jgi:hypothetical protein
MEALFLLGQDQCTIIRQIAISSATEPTKVLVYTLNNNHHTIIPQAVISKAIRLKEKEQHCSCIMVQYTQIARTALFTIIWLFLAVPLCQLFYNQCTKIHLIVIF